MQPCGLGAPFDVILCSDVLFDPAEWDALERSFDLLGAATGAPIYLAHRMRNLQEGAFIETLEAKSYHCNRFGQSWRVEDQGSAGAGGWTAFGQDTSAGPEGEVKSDKSAECGDVGGCRRPKAMFGELCPDMALYELLRSECLK
ncbi:unnamed protein product [Discosporangium mesarthrocarpum]